MGTNYPGYDIDPYKDEGAECDDAITKLFEKWTGKGGLFSTWRERHIFLAGGSAGIKAAQFADIPECPPLWVDEKQYFDWGAIITNVVKIYGTSAVATLSGVFVTLLSTGVIKL